mmetsp:Transcript_33745/g.95482  ORF Transcript_33745/g.95482 Transcript_33745/m.95482 type:complete len:789 (-) Transcript_33745:181-2547(-)
MGCCGGEQEIAPEESNGQFVTPFENRKCRDVFWLLCFIGFWGAMLFVAVYALAAGNSAKLLYGSDSMGNVCGSINTFDGMELDLRDSKKLYFLDPFEVEGLDIADLAFAKSVCVPSCPSVADLCNAQAHFNGSNVCNSGNLYRCPYYGLQTQRVTALGHYNLYHNLPSLGGLSPEVQTQYYDDLAGTNITDCLLEETDSIGLLSSVWDGALLSATTPSQQCGQYLQHMSKIPNTGPCFPVFASTVNYLNRCIPDTSSIVDNFLQLQDPNSAVSKALAEPMVVVQRYAMDLYKGIMIVFICGLLLGCVFALFWMTVLRYFAGIMAWFAVVLLNLMFAVVCVLCFQRAGLLGQAGAVGEYTSEAMEKSLPEGFQPVEKDKDVWRVVAWISLAVFVLILLFTLIMIRRIKIAVACLKVASQAVASMPSILFFPMLPFFVLVVFVGYWMAVAGMLYTVGTVTKVTRSAVYNIPGVQGLNYGIDIEVQTQDQAVDVSGMSDLECYHSPDCAFETRWDNTTIYLGLLHLFGLLWTFQFVLGIGYVVLAAAIGHFYWYRGDSSLMPRRTVLRSLGLVFRYHLGSIALGSLILAIIQFVRLLLEYLDRRTKRLQDTSFLLKWCFCCVKCCMWYLEKVVQYINKNAYILIGVKGTSYCTSAGRAVGLILSNVLRLAAVNVVGDFLIFMGKLCVVGGCGVVAFFFADIEYYTNQDKYPNTYLSSPVAPIVLTVIVAYACASVFFQVYEMAVDTVLLCFCDDCDVHGDPKFAPPLLMEAIGLAAHCKGKEHQQFITSNN